MDYAVIKVIEQFGAIRLSSDLYNMIYVYLKLDFMYNFMEF